VFRRKISHSSSVPKRNLLEKPIYHLLLLVSFFLSFFLCSSLKMEALSSSERSCFPLVTRSISLYYCVLPFVCCRLDTKVNAYSETISEIIGPFRPLLDFLERESAHQKGILAHSTE
jgi:hypothetical protein